MDEQQHESYFEGEPPYLLTTDDEFGTGTQLRTFEIIETKTIPEGYEVQLSIVLDSGYELEHAMLMLTQEDLEAYETKDLHMAVKYALGFFDE